MTTTRRSFIKGAMMASTALSAASCALKTPLLNPKGANGDIRMGVIGFNGQGGGHINQWKGIEGVRLVALCDVDEAVLKNKMNSLKNDGIEVRGYQDIRKFMEDKEVDAVSIATPNHWHALAAIWAIQTGKDVYVEKPVSHNVWEGRQIVNAANRYKKIVQTGTQSRSDANLRAAIEWLNEGHIGKLILSRGLCYKRRKSIGLVPGPKDPPPTVDYDLWLGPAPYTPLTREKLHYDWHWVYDTGNGDMGNQGIHQMDICRWIAGHDSISSRVLSVGGRLGYIDDGETPNTQYVYHEFPGKAPIIFETRGLPMEPGMSGESMPHYKGVRIGNVAHYEGGYLAGGKVYDNDGKEIKRFGGEGGAGHYQNFIDAVRSRKMSDLHAPILEGHLSSALCHTGMISHQLGQKADPKAIAESIKGNEASVETFERMKEHLEKNKVDINVEKLTIGPWVEFDPLTESVVKTPGFETFDANRMLTREYRRGFEVPDLS